MTEKPDTSFLPPRGGYRHLRAFQVATVIYDVTYHFAHHYIEHGDRTRDQMVQAARSGRQNIAEGSAAATTSRETELKLTNVALASLQELLLDYEDYLRVRGLEQWAPTHPKTLQTRQFCRTHNDPRDFTIRMAQRPAATVANIAIVLINQASVLLRRLIERQKADFLKYGGIKEQMYRARLAARAAQGGWGGQHYQAGRTSQTGRTGQTSPTGQTSQTSPTSPTTQTGPTSPTSPTSPTTPTKNSQP